MRNIDCHKIKLVKLGSYNPSFMIMLGYLHSIHDLDRLYFGDNCHTCISFFVRAVPMLFILIVWKASVEPAFFYLLQICFVLVNTEDIGVLSLNKLLDIPFLVPSIHTIYIPAPNRHLSLIRLKLRISELSTPYPRLWLFRRCIHRWLRLQNLLHWL